jgi:hypothetical protein
MTSVLKPARIAYEIVGGIAICLCLLWYVMYKIGPLNGSAPCVDTQITNTHSPGGKETAQQRFQTCGGYSSVEVLLNVPGTESNFMRVISLAKTSPSQVSVKWTGPNDLEITFPASAEIEEAYGVVWGVTIARNPIQ